MELPTIAILFMTKETQGREHLPERTIRAIHDHLRYDGPALEFVVVDGGSSPEYHQNLIQKTIRECGYPWISKNKDRRPGVGWNEGIELIWGNEFPAYLRIEDDFELLEDLDITPYVRLLMEREDVGMVRLGLMPIGLDLHSTAHDGRIYFDVKKSAPYCYSGNPCLVHKRMHEAYGMFDENANPGEIEVIFDHKVRTTEGPAIWYPWDLGARTYGIWAHIGNVQSY